MMADRTEVLYLGDRVEFHPGDYGVVVELEVLTSTGRMGASVRFGVPLVPVTLPYGSLARVPS